MPPLGRGTGDQTVVFLLVVLFDQTPGEIQREARAFRAAHGAHHALVVHAVRVRHSLVEGRAGVRRQIAHAAEEIRLFIPQRAEHRVVLALHLPDHARGQGLQQALGEHTAAVRGVDRGQRGDMRRKAEAGDRVAAVQPALGVGDQVDLVRAGLRQHLLDARLELGRGRRHGRGRLLAAVVKRRAAFLQGLRDAAPVVDVLPVAEKDAVHQHDRVARAAVLVFRVHGLALEPAALEIVFAVRGVQHAVEQIQVEHRHPPREQQQRAPHDAQPFAGDEHAEKAVYDQQPGHRHAQEQIDHDRHPCGRAGQEHIQPAGQPERDPQRAGRHDAQERDQQQLISAEQRAQAAGRAFGAARADVHRQIAEQQHDQRGPRRPAAERHELGEHQQVVGQAEQRQHAQDAE